MYIDFQITMKDHSDDRKDSTKVQKLFPKTDADGAHDSKIKKCMRSTFGFACAIGFSAALTVGACSAQALGGLVPPFELKCLSIVPEKRQIIWLMLVALASSSFNGFYYTSVVYLSVGTIGGLQPSLGLIFVALATLALDRQCPWHVVVASVICIHGVLLVTQP